MKEKYIEEYFNRWFVFGKHSDGAVDISDHDGDVLTKVPEYLANEIIKLRNRYVDDMVSYWMERPEEFFERIKRVPK